MQRPTPRFVSVQFFIAKYSEKYIIELLTNSEVMLVLGHVDVTG